jgi:type I restriction enzyme R subunit
MPQALTYAEMLVVPFAFSSNGDEFLFHDRTTRQGPVETALRREQLPGPDQLWHRYCDWKAWTREPRSSRSRTSTSLILASPCGTTRVLLSAGVVEAVAAGEKRLLLVMATGTGKTQTAFQVMWRLRQAGAVQRILFLVDRNVLADQAIVNDFRAFGPVMTKVSGKVDKSYEVYLALYQAVTGNERELYRQFRPDFFDLVVSTSATAEVPPRTQPGA